MFIKSTIGVILIIATFFDCREYRIPNACILELLGLGLIGQILQHGMPGFGYWILGFALTGMVVIPFVILRMFGAGDAKIWKGHANFIVNSGNATSLDVLKLIKMCYDEIYKDYMIKLSPEVRFIGDMSEEEAKIWNIVSKKGLV